MDNARPFLLFATKMWLSARHITVNVIGAKAIYTLLMAYKAVPKAAALVMTTISKIQSLASSLPRPPAPRGGKVRELAAEDKNRNESSRGMIRAAVRTGVSSYLSQKWNVSLEAAEHFLLLTLAYLLENIQVLRTPPSEEKEGELSGVPQL